jgi:hypothetical protein
MRIAAASVRWRRIPFSGDVIKLEGAGKRRRRRAGNYRSFSQVTRRQDRGHRRDYPPHVNDVLSFP